MGFEWSIAPGKVPWEVNFQQLVALFKVRHYFLAPSIKAMTSFANLTFMHFLSCLKKQKHGHCHPRQAIGAL
jgi:hypothetical protein